VIKAEPITPPAMAVVNSGQNSPPLTIRGTKPPWPIALLDHTQKIIEMVDNFVALSEQIMECSSMTSPNNYVLKIIEKDTESLERFIMQKLLRLGIVLTLTTNFIFCQKKYTMALTL